MITTEKKPLDDPYLSKVDLTGTTEKDPPDDGDLSKVDPRGPIDGYLSKVDSRGPSEWDSPDYTSYSWQELLMIFAIIFFTCFFTVLGFMGLAALLEYAVYTVQCCPCHPRSHNISLPTPTPTPPQVNILSAIPYQGSFIEMSRVIDHRVIDHRNGTKTVYLLVNRDASQITLSIKRRSFRRKTILGGAERKPILMSELLLTFTNKGTRRPVTTFNCRLAAQPQRTLLKNST